MTTYRGTVTILMSGELVGYGPFTASAPLTAEMWNATLTPDGMLWATLDGSGPLYVSAAGRSGSDYLYMPSTPFSTPIANPVVPYASSVPGLTINWSETNTFNAQRTAVSTTGAGTFSGVMEGIAVSGSISISGTLSASSSAYSIAALSAAVAEGDAGTTPFTFTVTRLGATDGFSTISWQVMGSGVNPAIATDFAGFTMPMGTLTFNAGETQKTLSVEVLGDDMLEGDEGFTVSVANAYGEVMAVTSDATGTIVNDDVSRFSLAAVQADLVEGAAGGTAFTFRISREGSTSAGASVSWTVGFSEPGSGGADGFDFQDGSLPFGTVMFLAGETFRDISVMVAGDAAPEAHETFPVTLYDPVGGTVAQGSATGLIVNDDGGSAQVADSTAADERFDLGDGTDLVRFTAARAQYRVGVMDSHARVQGPDGVDDLVDVEFLKFGGEATISLETLRGQPGTDELMRFLTTVPGGAQQLVYALPQTYVGPLALDYAYPGTDFDDVMGGTSRNDLVNLGAGNDAAAMGPGDDVVDGGAGSNFLSGGAGRDIFFLDGRFAVPVWSTITDWEAGEALTLWGWMPGVSVGTWSESAGAPGWLGATFFADIDGSGAVETVVTWSGRTVAELPASREMTVSGIGVLYFE